MGDKIVNDVTPTNAKVSSGVDELIQRLRQEGIDAGNAQAQERIQQAQAEADSVLAEAQKQARDIVAEAKSEAQRLQQAGNEALAIAMRDIVLKLKARLSETVGERVQQLIATQLNQEEFLQALLLELAGRVRRDAKLDEVKNLTVVLPEKLIGLEELRRHPLELQEGSLSHFVLHVAAEVLRDGVEFAQTNELSHGIRLNLRDREMQIDLTDERLAQVLLEHLQPRFRAILEGMVK